MMIAYLLEPFLTQYYLLDAVCGTFMTEAEETKLFYALANVFCIPESKELKRYYEDSRLAHFSEMKDVATYERLCRTIEFAQQGGQDIHLTDSDRIILAQKREAMNIKTELFGQAKNLTKEMVSSTLLTMAMNGNIDAMAMLSYMEYHGICVCKDTHNAIKRMRLCAKWNHLFGNLMGIAYDEENRQAYFDTLYTVLRNASQKQVFDYICTVRENNGVFEKNPVARIIEKAFGLNVVKRNIYDQGFAKVAFSELISVEDKEKILLNKQKDAIVSLSDIPFDVTWEDTIAFDEHCTDTLPLTRENEIKKILQNIAVARNCPAEAYTPLLIVASDDYVTDMYSKMLKSGFDRAAVIEVDAGTLSGQDFAGGKDNVFLRGLSETKAARTVFMLKHCEELEEEKLDELLKVLDYEYRKKFKLFQPPVSLDLSGLLFVLFAAEHNAGVTKLAACCDTVWTERISTEEKTSVVESVFHSRSRSFGCAGLEMEEGCTAFLAAYDTRQVQQIVDGALRCAIFEKSSYITLSSMQSVCKEQNITVSRRGFGYAGGNYHAKN